MLTTGTGKAIILYEEDLYLHGKENVWCIHLESLHEAKMFFLRRNRSDRDHHGTAELLLCPFRLRLSLIIDARVYEGSLFIFIFALFVGISVVPAFSEQNGKERQLIGGPCEYKLYKGSARIISIKKTGEGGNPSHDRYEVKFIFSPEGKITESFAQVDDKEFLLQLDSMRDFRALTLKQNGIRIGALLDCMMKVITRGTCTPVLFGFPSLKVEEGMKSKP